MWRAQMVLIYDLRLEMAEAGQKVDDDQAHRSAASLSSVASASAPSNCISSWSMSRSLRSFAGDDGS